MRLIAFVVGFLCVAGPMMAECTPDKVSVRGAWGQAEFDVEIVDTAQKRNQGLMFRESMPRFSGMLFVYKTPHRARFWMKNTLIPLDMIFIGPKGVVKSVHNNAIPHDETAIDGGDGVLLVLEVNGGMAKTLGIVTGSELRHPSIGADAVWPCE